MPYNRKPTVVTKAQRKVQKKTKYSYLMLGHNAARTRSPMINSARKHAASEMRAARGWKAK